MVAYKTRELIGSTGKKQTTFGNLQNQVKNGSTGVKKEETHFLLRSGKLMETPWLLYKNPVNGSTARKMKQTQGANKSFWPWLIGAL